MCDDGREPSWILYVATSKGGHIEIDIFEDEPEHGGGVGILAYELDEEPDDDSYNFKLNLTKADRGGIHADGCEIPNLKLPHSGEGE